ncbi:plexin-B-like [Ptychodera flava]|uniref:plexin-B-like n=1 Tax=Ptychodera flava TaxID=63121 RepID=UPI003969F011
MECISPPVDISVPPRKNRNTDAKEATVGFIMDAVEEVRQLRLDFEIVANPEYYPFAEEGHIREHQGEQLVIQGKDLNLASTESEVTVTIGQEECRVVSLSDVQLNCIPPDDEPKGVNKSGSPTENGLPEVIVEVGNLKFFIGYFKHPLTSHTTPGHTTPGHTTPGHTTPGPVGLIGGLVTAFVLLLVTVVVVIVRCVQKRTLNRRIAAVENRMETVGMEVRTEQGLPFSNYSKYIAKMVYDLNIGNKGLSESSQGNTDQAMDYLENFYSLLTNKSFCLVLIRTLEHQRRMTKDQKKSVGGLLTITLQKEKSMIYLSEILKDLLADAVTKENKTKRENVLTRDYSIAGSMLTAWFAITLYSYIKTNIGESIYELFIVMTTNAGTEPRDILRGPAKEKVIRICEEMLTLDEQHRSSFPAPIKYMFDTLDRVAENSGIDDRYVTERWKCDSLHVGLWAKILQCPEYFFDISPSDDVKRGLEVIAQAFIEICSESMNSVSEIIELHEEMLIFKTQLQTVIDDIKALPSVSEDALKQYLEDHAQHQSGASERLLALSKLVEFAIGFNDEIAEALLRDEKCKQDGHAAMFKKLISSMIEHQ